MDLHKPQKLNLFSNNLLDNPAMQNAKYNQKHQFLILLYSPCPRVFRRLAITSWSMAALMEADGQRKIN